MLLSMLEVNLVFQSEFLPNSLMFLTYRLLVRSLEAAGFFSSFLKLF
jgi:hypothetical protein